MDDFLILFVEKVLWELPELGRIWGLINPNFAISNGLNGKNIPDLEIHLNMGGNS